MYGQDILCGITQGTFEIPNKIYYPYNIHWKMQFLYNVEIWRAPGITSP